MNPIRKFVDFFERRSHEADSPKPSKQKQLNKDATDEWLLRTLAGPKDLTFLPASAATAIRDRFEEDVTVFTRGGGVRSVKCVGEANPAFVSACFFFAAFLDEYTGRTNDEIAVYYCDALPDVKTLSSDLSPETLNSGVTFFRRGRGPGREGPVVVVYRSEEAPKVAFHELIHAYGIDRAPSFRAASAALERIACGFGMASEVEIRAQETYTELLAAICHTVYSERDLGKLFEFFVAQSDKLLCVHGTNIRQRTHAIEYVVAKAALVKDVDEKEEVVDLFDSHERFCEALGPRFEAYVGGYRCTMRSLYYAST